MKPYTIYYANWCPFCQVLVHAFPYRKDIQWKDIDKKHYHKELLSKGGHDQVPCLVAGDEVIYDSKVILKYLNDHPEEEVKAGFALVKKQFMEEQQAEGSLWVHRKTGARLFTMACDDENKVFGIGFRTPSLDSTGAAHIVEHSVLSGSRKYKTKEPFMDLMKGSLWTFLNAMTYPDRTVYPVASRHDKDFKNLMDVYLDAVFYPSMGENPFVFAQEGWHWELHDPGDPLSIRGVVYNEMRGAYSSPDAQVSLAINRHLRAHSSYRFSSGGDPYEMSKLSYEDFLAFYHRYYHPSNSYLFLYGNMDMKETMKYLDEEYLSRFETSDLDSSLYPDPLPLKTRPLIRESYGLGEEESPEGRAYLTYNVIVGDGTKPLDHYTRHIMAEVLVESESAPLKKRLLDEGIGEDVYVSMSPGRSLDFSIIVKNAREEDMDRFVTIVEEECRKLVKEGIPQDLLTARLKKLSFELREGSDYPTKGVIYFLSAMGLWVYDSEPFDALQYEPLLAALEQYAQDGVYEQWIKEKLLHNPHLLKMVVAGDPGLFNRKDEALAQELAEKKDQLDDKALSAIMEQTKALEAMQLSEDSEEAKATIPTLHVSDLDATLPDIPFIREEVAGMPLYLCPQPTQGVVYGQWLFELKGLEAEEIPYVGLLADLLLLLDTTSHSYGELQDQIYLKTGGLMPDTNVYQHHSHPDKYRAFFSLKGKCLPEDLQDMLTLMEEVLYSTKFEDLGRLKQLLGQTRSKEEEGYIPNGHKVVMDRVASHFIAGDALEEQLGGIDYFLQLKEWEKATNLETIMARVEAVAKKIFLRGQAAFHLIAEEDILERFPSVIKAFLPPEGKGDSNSIILPTMASREGFLTSANVNYVSMGALVPDFTIHGVHGVLSQLLSDEYLHTHIRARGGAYGAGMNISRTGLIRTYSYRDPSVAETIKVYEGMGAFLHQMELKQKDVERLIIGTASRFNPPTTPSMAGNMALNRYLTGLDKATMERRLAETLEVTVQDLKDQGELLDHAMKAAHLCVMGNGTLLKSLTEEFDKLVDLGI